MTMMTDLESQKVDSQKVDGDGTAKVDDGTRIAEVPKGGPLKYGRARAREGKFSFRYLLVPAGWVPSDESRFVDQIFQGLGLAAPRLVFRSMESNHVVSFKNDKIGLRRDEVSGEMKIIYDSIENKVSQEESARFQHVLRYGIMDFMMTLTDTCGGYGAYYCIDCPVDLNVFEKFILDSLVNNGVVLLECNPWSQEESNLWDNMKHLEVERTKEEQFDLLRKHAKRIDEDVEVEVEWDPQWSIEQTFKHVIIFERKEERDQFHRFLKRDVPVGFLACCGLGETALASAEMLRKQLEYLGKGQPLFIFRHTIGAAHCLASLVDDIKNDDIKNAKQGMEMKKWASDIGEMNTELLEDDGKSLEQRCYVVGDDLEKSHSERLNPYELHSELMYLVLQKFKDNVPHGFNRQAVMVFDPLKDSSSKQVQKMTKVMSSIYDQTPEFGGKETEESVFMNAKFEICRLRYHEGQERLFAWTLWLLILFFTLATTALSCTAEFVKNSSPISQTVPPLLQTATIVLPILLAISLTVYQVFSPMERLSKIRLARAYIERILFRYRCRVGKFRAIIGEGAVHRRTFTAEMNAILDTLVDNQLTKYSLVSKTTNRDRNDNTIHYDSEKISDEDTFFLSEEDYIRVRIDRYRKSIAREASYLSMQLRILQCSTIVLSASTAIMSHLNLQLWIPVVLAIVTVLEGFVQYQQLSKRIETANVTGIRINKTYSWWGGLTMMERNFPDNKKRLVEEVEDAIIDRELAITDTIKAKEKEIQDGIESSSTMRGAKNQAAADSSAPSGKGKSGDKDQGQSEIVN